MRRCDQTLAAPATPSLSPLSEQQHSTLRDGLSSTAPAPEWEYRRMSKATAPWSAISTVTVTLRCVPRYALSPVARNRACLSHFLLRLTTPPLHPLPPPSAVRDARGGRRGAGGIRGRGGGRGRCSRWAKGARGGKVFLHPKTPRPAGRRPDCRRCRRFLVRARGKRVARGALGGRSRAASGSAPYQPT
jgi:hypothetical protein